MSALSRRAFVIISALTAAWLAIWSSSDALPRLSGLVPPARSAERSKALMTHLGESSRAGTTRLQPLEQEARAVAAREPLDPAPFLVAGGIAEQRGDRRRALLLYRAALSRDPRSQAAHYMLANRAIEVGEVNVALRHLAALARLSPGAGPAFSKLMLEVAGQDSGQSVLKNFLAEEDDQREALFGAMASDPQLAPRILSLAARRGEPPTWLPTLVTTLVQEGRSDLAASAWTRFGGGPDPRGGGSYDPTFQKTRRGGPFGWTIDSSAVGTVSPSPEGGLDVEAYGREAGRLMWQWTLLAPGDYRLAAPTTTSSEAVALEWRVECVSGTGRSLAIVPLGQSRTFDIPPGCAAQSLALWARAVDEPAENASHLPGVRLEPLR